MIQLRLAPGRLSGGSAGGGSAGQIPGGSAGGGVRPAWADASARVAEIRFDAPGEKVNLLTQEALALLAEILDRVETGCCEGSIGAVILTSGKKGVFLAGADVRAFVPVAQAGDAAAAAAKARAGQMLFSRLAALGVPTIAAINGACLGGGLELALACTSRLAGDSLEVSLGLPEVKLGLIPGWGGTQRLPRLVGLSRALETILTGRSLTARQAHKLGVVDAVVPIEGLEGAARMEAVRLAGGGRIKRPAWPLLDRFAAGRALTLSFAKRRVAAQTKGQYPAPPAAIEAIRHGLGRGIEEGLHHEADLVGRLLVGDVSKNLVGIFLASRAPATAASGSVSRASGSDSNATAPDNSLRSTLVPDGIPKPAPISRIGVLGAGTMGGGIAAMAAMSGVAVRLKDVSAEALARGMRQVHALASDSSRKGRLPRHEASRREALVAPTVDSSGFSRCDLVIEAVVEELEVKRQVLREMESLTSPSAIFATNTSSLSVAEIARGAARPGRVLGLHFFNPVEKMPLVEVVRAPATQDSAVEAAVALARRMGKTAVVVKDTPGFIVNRILMPYLAGAIQMLGTRLDVREIDSAMVRFGMPMGPFALLDRIGIDVAAKVADVLKAAFPDRPGDPRLLHAMMQAGLLGVKSSKGFYLYPGSSRGSKLAAGASLRVSREVALLLEATYRTRPKDGKAGTDISDTLVDSMINEAAHLLGEGAVERPEVIDLAMVFGAGFPPFRGGLLRHADSVGAGTIAERMRARGVTPAPLLLRRERFYP